jgi:hypothetical protein
VFVILREVVEKCRLSRFRRKNGLVNEVRIEEIDVEVDERRLIHWPWTINWRSAQERSVRLDFVNGVGLLRFDGVLTSRHLTLDIRPLRCMTPKILCGGRFISNKSCWIRPLGSKMGNLNRGGRNAENVRGLQR